MNEQKLQQPLHTIETVDGNLSISFSEDLFIDLFSSNEKATIEIVLFRRSYPAQARFSAEIRLKPRSLTTIELVSYEDPYAHITEYSFDVSKVTKDLNIAFSTLFTAEGRSPYLLRSLYEFIDEKKDLSGSLMIDIGRIGGCKKIPSYVCSILHEGYDFAGYEPCLLINGTITMTALNAEFRSLRPDMYIITRQKTGGVESVIISSPAGEWTLGTLSLVGIVGEEHLQVCSFVNTYPVKTDFFHKDVTDAYLLFLPKKDKDATEKN